MQRRGNAVEIHDLPASKGRGAAICDLLFKTLYPPKMRAGDVFALRRILPELNCCDAVVASASGLAFALAVLQKAGMLSARLAGIHCGIVNVTHSRLPAAAAARLLPAMATVLFADSEEKEMRRQFGLKTAVPLWFGVDHLFWTPPAEPAPRSGVLAVGNDARRDFETLLGAATRMPDVPFRVVTRRPRPEKVPANVEWTRGDWKGEGLSDDDLREAFRRTACAVVPLHESPQPSGQSVAMQALMCGAPAVVTRTSGWWGGAVLNEGSELQTVPPADGTLLAGAIERSMQAPLTGEVRGALLRAEWTMEGFSRRLEDVIAARSARSSL